MTKPAISDTAVCKEMARRLLKISLIPAVKNILELINLPAHVPRTHEENVHLRSLPELELSQTITAYSDDMDAEALKIEASIRRKHAEHIDDFLVRCSYLLSNLFNAYIIPTYLVHTLKEVGKYGGLPIPVWSNMVHVAYSTYEGNLFVHRHVLYPDQLVLLDSKTIDGCKTEFFVAAGEYLKQQIAEIVTDMAPRRPSKLVLSVLLAPEFITAEMVKCVEASVPELETIVRGLQLLPIYRSLLSASTNDFGVTYAPYYLGVGCSSTNYVEMASRPMRQTPRPIKRHKLQACIYLYGAQAETLPMGTFDIATRHIKMSMLTLYEIAFDKEKAPLFADAILPFGCAAKREIPHSAVLAPFFQARGIKTPSPLVDHNQCTVLDVRINPSRASGKRTSAKMLSSYLHLLIDSGKHLFGLEHNALAYVETVQDMDETKNVTVLHVLEIGTPPSPGSPYNICETADLIAYDEASYNAQRREAGITTRNSKMSSVNALAAVLEAIFASSNKRFSVGVLDAITRSAGFATNVDAFLSTGTARCTIVIQDAQHTMFRSAALYEELASVSDSVEAPSTTASFHSPAIIEITESPIFEDHTLPSITSTTDVERSPRADVARWLMPISDDQSVYVNCESSGHGPSPFSSPSLHKAMTISRPHSVARQQYLLASPQTLPKASPTMGAAANSNGKRRSGDAGCGQEAKEPKEYVVESSAQRVSTGQDLIALPVVTSAHTTCPETDSADATVRHYNRVITASKHKSCGSAFAILLSCIVLLSLTAASYVFFCRRIIDVAIVQRYDAIFIAGISSALVLFVAVAVAMDRYWTRTSRQPLVETLTESAATTPPSCGLSAPISSAAIDHDMHHAK